MGPAAVRAAVGMAGRIAPATTVHAVVAEVQAVRAEDAVRARKVAATASPARFRVSRRPRGQAPAATRVVFPRSA